VSTTPGSDRPLSALPSIRARAIAFAGILISGIAGAAMGYLMVDVQCSGSCAVPTGIGMFTGSLIGASGMSVVAVLALRAIGEWRELADKETRTS
jgi:predicted membrane GTPase involved in stress response